MIGSDPGGLRLRTATRTTAALACALGILFLLTKATGQPVTVALLGVLITMVAARSVNEPDPRQQKLTMALLPLPAALAISAGTLLAPHKLVSDVVFVAVVFVAVYIRRFGPRGRALGMVMFMAYFFTLFLRATTAELPWLFGAVLVGTLCSFVFATYVLPDKPERVLSASLRSLRARMAIVVDTTAEALRAGRLDERRRRRLRARIARLNETALMVQSQLEDKVNPATLPGITGEQLALWLFDAELTVERVATAGARAAMADIPAADRAELAAALTQLGSALRQPDRGGLEQAAATAQRLLDQRPTEPTRRLAMAIIATATATSEVRARVEQPESTPPAPPPADTEPESGLRPTTRQAIQVAVAASLAIVVGELVSPARWYWAVIAAFVIFAGTNSWGETLTKGWQRLLGTALGVPSGVLIATLVSGDRVASLVLIFVCLFCAFYVMKVAYSMMIFWITTMLALLYGLLGQFTVHLLLLRIEETAIGAVIGAAVAILVLPTDTRKAIRDDAHTFLTTLSNLIDASATSMFADTGRPTELARQLDRDLQQYRVTAKPLMAGVAGLSGRRSIRRGLRMLAACDHYGRTLARNSGRYDAPPELADAVAAAAAQVRRNIDALDAARDGTGVSVAPATDHLDAAETRAGQNPRLLAALHALRQIDRAVVTAAVELGADDAATRPVSSR
ncbi:FUSC family protein [Mycobacterium sp. MFM001]|uniref:FUSC family protein n=1 Tax=Mycobacterium sp. MFM001 TaxID=2049453 RepID=UPI000E2FBE78|nr:FUSC family protein [Mycobacterium sp. MFM001]